MFSDTFGKSLFDPCGWNVPFVSNYPKRVPPIIKISISDSCPLAASQHPSRGSLCLSTGKSKFNERIAGLPADAGAPPRLGNA